MKLQVYIIYKIPGYETRFCGKKQYLSWAVFTDSLGYVVLGRKKAWGRAERGGKDSDTYKL